MKLNQIDAGGSHPWPEPKSGQTSGSVFVEGSGGQNYARGNSRLSHTFPFWIRATSALGGSAAGSAQALKYLLTQIHELVKNPDLQPVYLQPLATAESGASSAASEFDGWYWLEAIDTPHKQKGNINSGIVAATLQATPAGPATVRRVGQSFVGGALSTGYSGTAVPWVGFSVNSTPAVSSTTRTGSDGAIPIWLSPAVNPAPFVMPATIADLFKGGCHVYDSMSVGGNAVPTDGSAVHATWVEVFGPEHVFTGDMIVLNGLSLQRYQTGVTATIGTVWLWSSQLVTPAWQQWATLQYQDNAGNSAVLRQVSIDRLGLEEVQLKVVGWTSAGNEAIDTIRLQRGAFGPRVEFRPQSQANTYGASIMVSFPANAKIEYNSSGVVDYATVGSTLATAADYGYAGAIIANASYPFIGGLLWQSVPANQPGTGLNQMSVGDTAGPGQNISRTYGLFAIPFPTPQNLQAEAESGTLGTGWTSQAGAGGNSNALEAKCASGTLTGNADTFGTAWVPPAGAYDVWFRVKVTSAAGAASEMKLGLYNSTDSVFVSSTTYKANQVTTAYVWYKVAAAVTPTAAKNMRFRAETAATLGTDWFIDEATMVPTTNGKDWPQDLGVQFLSDHRVELALA